jgi:hypothetical protein
VALKVAFSLAFSEFAIVFRDDEDGGFGFGFFAAIDEADAVPASSAVAQRAAIATNPARLTLPRTSDDGTLSMQHHFPPEDSG